MKLFTIGFTKTSAENFFHRLSKASINRIIDVRLNNVSQLAAFAKRDDLKFFAKALCDADYVHSRQLAPTREMLDEYKKRKGSWEDYERKFLALMAQRKIEEMDQSLVDQACLLCSEDKPHHCHRRLVAEYLQQHWPNLQVVHL